MQQDFCGDFGFWTIIVLGLTLLRFRTILITLLVLPLAVTTGLGLEGSLERMTPIRMTSLTSIFGVIPIVLAYSKPGGELLAPLALVRSAGL